MPEPRPVDIRITDFQTCLDCWELKVTATGPYERFPWHIEIFGMNFTKQIWNQGNPPYILYRRMGE